MVDLNCWWETKKFKKKQIPSEVAQAVYSTVQDIKNTHTVRVKRWRDLTEIYLDQRITGFEGEEWSINPSSYAYRNARFNVLRSSIDTIQAKITQHEPAPSCHTYGGNAELTEKAQGLEKLVLGVMQKEQAHKKGSQCFKESGLYGISYLKVYNEGQDIKLKKVHPSRIIIDEGKCVNDPPTSMYHVEKKSKEYLKAMYPKFEAEIDMAEGNVIINSSGNITDHQVEVVEAWHLPVGKKKGRRVICISNSICICDEDYTAKSFPFVVGRWDDNVQGFYGLSLAEQLYSVQQSINEASDYINDCMRTNAAFWLMPTTAGIKDGDFLNNETNRVVKYNGQQAPQRIAPNAVNSQDLQILKQYIDWGYEISGVSQLSATSQQPKNFESGAAIRTYLDVETVRHSLSAKQWENWYVELFYRIIECAERVASEYPGWAVNYLDNDRVLNKVKWADVKLEDNQFQMRVYPVSALPQQPAARIERVLEFRKNQLITQEEFRQLSQMPDLEELQSLKGAPRGYLRKCFEFMLREDGEYIAPLPEQPNLEEGVKLCSEYYMREKIDRFKDNNYEGESEGCDRLARWISEAVAHMQGASAKMIDEPQPPMQPGQEGMMPPGAPGMPPGPEGMMPPEQGMMPPEMEQMAPETMPQQPPFPKGE